MRDLDPKTLHDLESKAREIGHLIGGAVDQLGKGLNGFCLMLYSFNGPELTWISNGNREDMVKIMREFVQRLEDNMAG